MHLHKPSIKKAHELSYILGYLGIIKRAKFL